MPKFENYYIDVETLVRIRTSSLDDDIGGFNISRHSFADSDQNPISDSIAKTLESMKKIILLQVKVVEETEKERLSE